MFVPGPPCQLMIFSPRKIWERFVYPQLHHVMDFPFPSNRFSSGGGSVCLVLHLLWARAVGAVFWQNDFMRFSFGYCHLIFSPEFCVGNGAQKEIHPRQSSLQQNPRHFSADWPGQGVICLQVCSRPLLTGHVRPQQGTEICNFGARSLLVLF